jgi:NAD(P)-dependent dehydrogenase (short-subunit alcohol dehydrogenase family)
MVVGGVKVTAMGRLEGKVVLITGAKGGLGSFVTEEFLKEGAQVAGVSRSIADADFASDRFTALPAELGDAEAATKVVAAVVERFGQVDALVHLLGVFAGGTAVADTDDAVFDRMFEMNVRSAFLTMRAVLPHMRQRRTGRILAVGSKAAIQPQAMSGAYGASKAALVSLVQCIAAENRDVCISANVVLPGTMDTKANRAADPDADVSLWVQPSQVASLLVHLASDAGAHVNGAAIPVYGRGV